MYTNEEIIKIYDAPLKYLKREHGNNPSRALEMLSGAGARVDASQKRVFFPRDMVEKCLAMAPENSPAAVGRKNLTTRQTQRGCPIRTASGAIDRFDLYRDTTARLTCADIAEQAQIQMPLPMWGVWDH